MQDDSQAGIGGARQGVDAKGKKGAEKFPEMGHFRRFCYGSVTYVQFPDLLPVVMEVATFGHLDSSYGYRRGSEVAMAEKGKEVWLVAALEPEREVTPEPSRSAAPLANREAMSWIRALANDWEDTRSHGQASK